MIFTKAENEEKDDKLIKTKAGSRGRGGKMDTSCQIVVLRQI